MARTETFYGLNKWARKLVARTLPGTVESTVTYANGRTAKVKRDGIPAVVNVEVLDAIPEREDSVLIRRLQAYHMHNGVVLEEFVQEHFHCGGPCYWIALRYRSTGRVVKSSLWTQKEIRGY